MEKIDTDNKRRTRKIQAKLFKVKMLKKYLCEQRGTAQPIIGRIYTRDEIPVRDELSVDR